MYICRLLVPCSFAIYTVRLSTFLAVPMPPTRTQPLRSCKPSRSSCSSSLQPATFFGTSTAQYNFFRSDDLILYLLQSGELGLKDVISYARTETYARDIVLSLFHRRITSAVAYFMSQGPTNNHGRDTLRRFFAMLHASGAVIGGSVALKTFQFPRLQWPTKDLNIFTPRGTLDRWSLFLQSNGFVRVAAPFDLDTYTVGTYSHRIFHPCSDVGSTVRHFR